MSDPEPEPVLPDDHPLADADELETHADHLDALSEYLDDVDPEYLEGLMVVTVTEDGIDTVPTLTDRADVEEIAFQQLAAHLSHVSQSFAINPGHASTNAIRMIDKHPGPEVYSE